MKLSNLVIFFYAEPHQPWSNTSSDLIFKQDPSLQRIQMRSVPAYDMWLVWCMLRNVSAIALNWQCLSALPTLESWSSALRSRRNKPPRLTFHLVKAYIVPLPSLPSLPSLLMFCLSRWAWNATARRDMISWLIWIWRWWQNWRSGEQWSGTISSVRPRFRVFPLLRSGPRNTVFL